MNQTDIAELMKGIAPVVRDYVAKAVAPLLSGQREIERTLRLEIEGVRALGSDVGARARRDSSALALESRAVLAEARAELTELKATLQEERRQFGDEIKARLETLRDGIDGKDGAPGKDGDPGRDADITDLREEVSGLVAEARATLKAEVDLVAEVLANVKDGAPGTAGEPGQDADPREIAALLVPEVERAVATHVKDAVAAQVQPVEETLAREWSEQKTAFQAVVEENFARLSAALERIESSAEEAVSKRLLEVRDGKDADPAEIQRMISEAVAAIPAPQDGKDADPALVEALVEAMVEKRFSALPAPKDGRDGVDGKDAEIPEVPEDVAYQVTKALEILKQPAILFPALPPLERQPQPVVSVVSQPRPRLRSAIKGKGGEIHFQYDGDA